MTTRKTNLIKITVDGQEIESFPYQFDFESSWCLPKPWIPTVQITDFSIPPLHDNYGQPIIFTAPDVMQLFKEDVIRTINIAFEQNPTKAMVVVNLDYVPNQKFIGVRYIFGNKDHYIEHMICNDGPITDEMITTAKPDIINSAYRFWFPENYPRENEATHD